MGVDPEPALAEMGAAVLHLCCGPGRRLWPWWEGGLWKEGCPRSVQHQGGKPGPRVSFKME